jgi:hypothetical protein
MVRAVAPLAIRWGIRPLLGHGRAAWVAPLQGDNSCMRLLQQECEASPRALAISMADSARRVVGQHRRPSWVRLFCVPAASTVEGARLFAPPQWCFPASSLVMFYASRWLLVSVVCDHVSIPSWWCSSVGQGCIKFSSILVRNVQCTILKKKN